MSDVSKVLSDVCDTSEYNDSLNTTYEAETRDRW